MSGNLTPNEPPLPQQSPDYFKLGSKGQGVKRLNSKPVWLSVFAAAGVMLAIGYTFHLRSKSSVAAGDASQQQAEGTDAGSVSVLKDKPLNGEIPDNMRGKMAALDRGRGTADHAGGTKSDDRQSSGNENGQKGEDPAAQARRQAWQTYYQQVAELQRARFQAESGALSSGIAVTTQSAASASGSSAAGLDQQIAQAQAAAGQAQNALGAASAASGESRLPAFPAGGSGTGGYPILPPAGPDQAGAKEKQAFVQQTGNLGQNDTLGATVRDAITPYLVTAGDVIPCVAQGGEDSDTPGQFVGRVSRNIYDSATGRYLLIPQNSKVVGTYDNVVTNGQTRIPTVITRIIFPDSSSIPLGAMPAADQSGFAGLHDLVDEHLWEKFGNAAILAVGSAGIQLSQGTGQSTTGYSSQQIGAAAIGQQFGELGQEFARSGLSIPNTIKIRNGYDFVVQVTKDIILRPYLDHRSVGFN
jgi:type IV secretory pathway VirB10-like protein